ncbi:hypothetical protein EDD18DRAFT_1106729 [Armillaria luteobubalina]|uniref:Uncharacterized protein n=1 Tax=Armillaria luteobubalina TaxID=153913 RepID=A0AA39TMG1_9AGAR|nr:hypothetical protein EDD18DRAFT_1106729 [Armillaria luteobubalina]
MYAKAVKEYGSTGASVVKVDSARTTKNLMGDSPADYDPALANECQHAKIARHVKKAEHPYRTDIEGVFACQLRDSKELPAEQQYIQVIHISNSDSDAGNVIVTMFPNLAELFHKARTTLHDNTYKWIQDPKWKEWEIGVTIAHLYMDRETRSAFWLVWKLLWDMIEKITHHKVKFKALHDRNFNKLAHHLMREEKDIVCSICHIEDLQKVWEYWDWCKNHLNPHIHDWSANKKGQPYFVALINEHHTNISEEDWFLSPSNTDMNESAHPYTNLWTGTHLSLADGIELSQETDNNIATLFQANQAVISATSEHRAAIADLSCLKDLKKQLQLL